MIVAIHPDNPDPRKIQMIVQALEAGSIIIYPTDTVYSFGCDINNTRGIERIAKMKGKKLKEANFSIVCHDLSQLSNFCKPISSPIFKMMKRALPGAFTFILDANTNVPKLFREKKKTIGIRVPDNNIARAIVAELGRPIIASSVHDEDKLIEYTTDPELIDERLGSQVELVVAGGFGGIEASTIVDCTGGEMEIIREGKGPLDLLD
jgi:tRNA threonylcarbamoyl adenosine modification protein (Sua5/YciO/YrdC/YwlC family)